MTPRSAYENPVTDFLAGFINKKTRSNYKAALDSFLCLTTPAKIQRKNPNVNVAAKHYLKEIGNGNRDHLQDLKLFSMQLIENYAATTTHLYLRNVIVWLEDNGCKITKRERKRLTSQLPPPYPKIEDIEMKRKTFRQIYYSLPDDVSVLFLFLLASGMRLGEALKLKKEDVDWSQKRVEVTIPGTISKTKVPRKTYLTDEAAETLQKYLEERTDTADELFFISYASAQRYLRNVSEQLGYTQVINGKTVGFHWHMTRKWFISRFSLATSRDIAEHLAGHEGYLSRSYRRYTKKQILKQYKRAEKKISILKNEEDGLGGI